MVGKLVVLTGPSGVGKGTLLKLLLKRNPQLYLSISATTRSPRIGEVDGVNYYFLSRSRFEEMINNQELLEYAEYAGNYYGTPIAPVSTKINDGETVILEIELAGARQVKQVFADALTIFILPPTMEELESRIRSRGLDSEEAIDRRLKIAHQEISAKTEFDYHIVNDNLERALAELESIMN
jgi:guanylate kinase